MMAHQPQDPLGHEAVKEDGSLEFVTPVEALSNIMEEGGRPHLLVGGRHPRVLEHLQGVKQGVPFGMPSGVLFEPVEAAKKPDQFPA